MNILARELASKDSRVDKLAFNTWCQISKRNCYLTVSVENEDMAKRSLTSDPVVAV